MKCCVEEIRKIYIERDREIERNKQYEPRMLMPFGINLNISDMLNTLGENISKSQKQLRSHQTIEDKIARGCHLNVLEGDIY